MKSAERFAALGEHADPLVRKYFSPGEPVFIASASGRLDLMGGIADSSGSRALELPPEGKGVSPSAALEGPTLVWCSVG